jgi:hypothetical protein
MRPSLYEFAGGGSAFLALAAAHHARCLADPELNHPFSHPDQHPQHVERLAAYWAEVMGGPATYSDSCADQSFMLQLHAGNGDMTQFAVCLWPCDSPHVWPSESPHLIGLIHQLGPLGGDGGGANQHTDHPGDTAIEVSEGTYGHCRRV